MNKTCRMMYLLAAGACLFVSSGEVKSGAPAAKPEAAGAQWSGREGQPDAPPMIAIKLPADGAPAPPLAQSRWIAPAANPFGRQSLPLLRKEFSVDAKPGKATLRIVGLGDYDPRLNGARLADTGINQPWSQYEKTIYYRDFDVTSLVQAGPNCLGVMLGNSFWHNPNPPPGRYNKDGPQRRADEPLLLCAELTIVQEGGAVRRIVTNGTWRAADGPIVFSHVYGGEDFDARREQPGWDRPGFDDRTWRPARVVAAPTARLEKQQWPPIKMFQRFAPRSVKEPAPGVFLYSFPQNCAAQLCMELAGGKAGDRVAFRCAEHKNAQDRLFGGYVVGCDLVTDGRPLKRQWLFFYLGMQYVEVAGAVPEGQANPRNLPTLRRVELVHVRTALSEVGEFKCSSALLNRTHDLIDWALRSNMSHVMTDCPHREKLGWLECAYLLEPSFLYRYEGRQWFAKIARDIGDAQSPSGRVPTVAPSYPAGRFPGAFDFTVEWGAAAVMVPWFLYEWYGDPQILRDNFETMRRYVDYLDGLSIDGVAPGDGLGDWFDYGHGKPPGPSQFTPPALSATATWGLCAGTVARAAEVLHRRDDAEKYRRLHEQIAAAFRRRFQDPATRKLKHWGSPQTANAMALCAELIPASDWGVLIDDIVADLQRRNWQQTPGDVGHVYFIRALAEAGRSDILHKVYGRMTSGSYGGILSKDLTALPESWDAIMNGSCSLNHCMLGHVMQWLYGYVGGIRQKPGSVGWKQVVIAPTPGSLTWAEAGLTTPAGHILSRWRIQGATFHLEVEIPAGVGATAILPSGRAKPLRPGLQEIVEPWKVF